MSASLFYGLGTQNQRVRALSKLLRFMLLLMSGIMAAVSVASAAETPRRVRTLQDRTLLLRGGRFDPHQRADSLNLEEVLAGPKRHVMVQFGHMLSRSDKVALRALGIRPLRYVPHNTYWISVDPAQPLALKDVEIAGGVQWAWAPTPQYKMSEAVRQNRFSPHVRYDDGSVQVRVLMLDDVSQAETVRSIKALGRGVRVLNWKSNRVLTVQTPLDAISELAFLDEVEWVEPGGRPKIPHNETAAQRIHVDVVRGVPLSLDGTGVTVGVWDSGQVFAHQDFDTRLTVGNMVDVKAHSTHVAGTIGGSGFGNSNAMGMAPAVHLWSYDWSWDELETRGAMANGIVISNHSYGFATGWESCEDVWVDDHWERQCDWYGDSGFGDYSTVTQEWDDIVFDTDLLIFRSAGNDRNDGPDPDGCPGGDQCDGPYDSIDENGVAKNILTIGATKDLDGMTSFSSWGPADDGRVKPDLCANGAGLLSTLPNNQYESWSGTSMSSPSAAGAAALLYEHFKNVTGQSPAAATLKALMIHGAEDLGRPGPDYEFGWGLIDAEVSATLITGGGWENGNIAETGSSQTYDVTVPAGTEALKATVVWTDPAGSPAAALDLVNDLDLILIDPNGVEYEPWILDKGNPEADATTGANHVDNVEQVLVSDPIPGVWTIQISGFAVAFGPQTFTVVGVEACPDSDGDGVSDCTDGCPDDPDKAEPGDCGCGVADTDSDDDGTPDCNDGCPDDPAKMAPGDCGCGAADTDSDDDGTLDCNDGCPDDPAKTAPGDCGCGVADTDSDDDGTLDCNDGCPDDPAKTAPGDCGCGVADTDSDNDGTPDCNDGCPDDPAKTGPGDCGCGDEDRDSDGDGLSDCVDGCVDDPDKTEPGDCGCGVPDSDSDGDGTPNCDDGCPADPDKTAPGVCGCGVGDSDSDGDGFSDCTDNCPGAYNPDQADSDGDGIGDACNGINFSQFTTVAYSNQDKVGTVDVEDGGVTLHVAGNRWRRTVQTFTVTADTVLEFDFKCTSQGEIHGIGFDEDNDHVNAKRVFQLFGTQPWPNKLYELGDPYTVSDMGNYVHFSIPVGQYYSGTNMRLVFVNDDDRASPSGTSWFNNVRIVDSSNTAPTVTITAPADGTEFTVGTSVQFTGTAEDTEDGDLTGSIEWRSNRDGYLCTGGLCEIVLSSGFHTITAAVNDSGGRPGEDSISVTVTDDSPIDTYDFSQNSTVAYSNQDIVGTVDVEDGGVTLHLAGNRWRRTVQTFTVTADTVLEFDFKCTSQGEIHGIGFDEDNDHVNAKRVFQLFGTQPWPNKLYELSDPYTVSDMGNYVHFSIPVGQYYSGTNMRLVFVNDDDRASPSGTSWFNNVRIVDSSNTAPTVTITAPADGTEFTVGTSVQFTGTAEDTEDGDLTGSIEWRSNRDGYLCTGGLCEIVLSSGFHTITAAVNDSGGRPGEDSISVTVTDDSPIDTYDFSQNSTVAYSNQDKVGTVDVEDGGVTLHLAGNRWRRTVQTFTITADTVLEFDFKCTSQGEIHGIGFDEDNDHVNAKRVFQLFGTQPWPNKLYELSDPYTVSDMGNYVHFSIPVGQYYSGTNMRLVFVNDDDRASPSGTSWFSNVRIVDSSN